MRVPLLEGFLEGLQAWMERHSKLTGRVLFWALVLSVVWVGVFFAATVAVLVMVVWIGISKEAVVMLTMLTFGLWIGSAVPFFLHRNRDPKFSRGLRAWMQGAQEGDPASRWKLVEVYLRGGHGLRADPAQAAFWLRKLAEQGDVRAMAELAALLMEGHGLVRDRGQAWAWLQRAAEAGHEPAKGLMAQWEERQTPRPTS